MASKGVLTYIMASKVVLAYIMASKVVLTYIMASKVVLTYIMASKVVLAYIMASKVVLAYIMASKVVLTYIMASKVVFDIYYGHVRSEQNKYIYSLPEDKYVCMSSQNNRTYSFLIFSYFRKPEVTRNFKCTIKSKQYCFRNSYLQIMTQRD